MSSLGLILHEIGIDLLPPELDEARLMIEAYEKKRAGAENLKGRAFASEDVALRDVHAVRGKDFPARLRLQGTDRGRALPRAAALRPRRFQLQPASPFPDSSLWIYDRTYALRS